MARRGEYEPEDSRNVTGTATTPDGRWTSRQRTPPLANGKHPRPPTGGGDDGEPVDFEPAPELQALIRRKQSH